MKIKKFNFVDKLPPILKPKVTLQNPFTKGAEGRREWDDRYMNMSKAIKHWQTAFFSAIAAVVICAIVIAKIATESRIQPFVVETNQGMPYALKPMESISPKDEKLISFSISQFIINARSVVNDPDAEKAILNKVYAYSANNTIGFLHEYFEKNNPFLAASQYTVAISNVIALPISKNTWQVTWDETKRSTTGGNTLGVTHWMGYVTYKFGEINPRFVNDNPFGLYITEVSWAQSQTH